MSDLVRSGKRFNIVVSILIAVLLWFYVVNVENPVGDTMLSNVPIVLQGEDVLREKGLIVTDLSRETVNLKADGKRKTFLTLYRSNVMINVDVSDIDQIGDHQLKGKVMPDSLRADTSINLSEKDNLSVMVTVKKLASKEVPVEGKFIGDVASGFEAEPVQVNPNKIEVRGPEEVIEKISHATVLLEGEFVKDNINEDAPFVLMDEQNNVIQDKSVSYHTQTIAAFLPVVRVFDVSLKVEIKSGGGATAEDAVLTISPSIVKLSGSEDKLRNLKELSLGEIDLAEVFQNKSQTFPIPFPEGMENRSGVKEATVSVTIEHLSMKSITANQITIMNAPDGHEVSLVDGSLQVWVRGKQAELDRLSGDNIRVLVDLTGTKFKKGQQRAKATVYLEGISDVGILGTNYSVAIVMK
ncbi:MAG: putative secreted protein associated with spyDAC [Evtepia sp.]|jgi:YbbR domain-containing protein|nr:putative secreted protein associated with spyDAC [Evtepia sp.]